MEESNRATSKHQKIFNPDIAVVTESVHEQSRNTAVNSMEAQKNETFVEEPLSSSSPHHQPPADNVELLSAVSIPLSIISPGTIPYGGNLTVPGIDYEKVASTLQTVMADDNLELSTYPLNKKLKKASIYPEVHCYNQTDKRGWEGCLVSLKQNRYRNHCTGVEASNLSETGGKHILSQYSSSVEQWVYEENYNVTRSDAVATIALRASKEASSSTAIDKRRRQAKITEAIKALEESTPQFGKGTRESVLDDVIDYIKYLKLQVMALSQRRLGGEPVYYPFIHLEGFGHYMLHQQMPSEPLEEVVGHLLDSNMPLAVQLLDSKGLELLPISSADTIVKASADKFI